MNNKRDYNMAERDKTFRSENKREENFSVGEKRDKIFLGDKNVDHCAEERKTDKVSLILTCAGKGERAGFGKNKLLVDVNGTTVIARTLSVFVKSGLIDEYVVTASEQDLDSIKKIVGEEVTVVLGGRTRTESIKNALPKISGNVVIIHDGARPFVTRRVIKDCIESAKAYGSGVAAIKSKNTVAKSAEENRVITEYVGKDDVYIIQTPQAFRSEEIKKAYALADGKTFNDDGEVYSRYISPARLTDGDEKNVKLTYPEDFELLKSADFLRAGTGFDCHRLVENRKLILGGITVPHDKGLLGHSDADVLTHAIMDAALSAAGLRDIGFYFPDTDDAFKGADSILLLKRVIELIAEKGYKINNVSATIMAQKPKLLKFIPQITKNLAETLNVSESAVGIAATTLEGLGFIGREEGICVNAVVTLKGKL